MARAVSFLTLDKKERATLPEEVLPVWGVVPKDQLWFHQPEMQARIRRAESDLAEGRLTRTQTPEEAQSFLDGLKKASTANR